MADDLDQRAAAFHDAWKRRQVIGFTVLGIGLLVAGIAGLVLVLVGAYDSDGKQQLDARGMAGLLMMMAGGAWCFRVAYRIHMGRIRNPDREYMQ